MEPMNLICILIYLFALFCTIKTCSVSPFLPAEVIKPAASKPPAAKPAAAKPVPSQPTAKPIRCETFYRDQLKTAQAKAFYDGLCSMVSGGDTGGSYTLDYTNIATALKDGQSAMKAVYRDHPEWFFLCGTRTAVIRDKKLTLRFEELYTPEQIRKIRRYLKLELNDLAAGTAGLPDWDREKLVYERLRQRLTYADHSIDKETKHYDHNIVGPLLQHSGVCESFTCLLVLALRRVGIPAIRLSGRVGETGSHGWVMAWIYGGPVHLDLTLDKKNSLGDVGFFMFNLTDEQITRDHKIDTKGLPRCIDPTKGYHFEKDTVFSTAEDAVPYLKKVFSSGKGSCTIRFGSEKDVAAAVKKAMSRTQAKNYFFHYSSAQQTALIWTE